MEWIKVTDNMPVPGIPVLAVFLDERYPDGIKKKLVPVVVRAHWLPQWFEVAGTDDDEQSEYNEEKDEYYVPQGWYEMNEQEETHWMLPDTVTHWMPLPQAP